MDTLSSKTVATHAVIPEGGLPGTASYVPIVIGPGPSAEPDGGPLDTAMLNFNVFSSAPGYNGNLQVDVRFFGISEDASGNTTLIDDILEIPETKPNGQPNRKQTVQLGTATAPTVVQIFVSNIAEVAVLMVARPRGAGNYDNMGAYWFDLGPED